MRLCFFVVSVCQCLCVSCLFVDHVCVSGANVTCVCLLINENHITRQQQNAELRKNTTPTHALTHMDTVNHP